MDSTPFTGMRQADQKSAQESLETCLRRSGTSLCFSFVLAPANKLRDNTSPVTYDGIPDIPMYPVRNSITVHPSNQMSDLVDAPLNSMTSGAIQLGVPATSLISRSIARKLRSPKVGWLHDLGIRRDDIRHLEIAVDDVTGNPTPRRS